MKKIKLIVLTLLALSLSSCFSESKQVVPSPEVVDEFYDAVFANNTQKALKMIGTKFPANYEPKNKIAPLQAAIWQNNLAVVKALVEGGAVINKPKSDESYVETAADKGTLEILKYLIQKGGNINNSDAFNTAGFGNFYDCAKLLLLKGANQEKGDIRGKFHVFEEAVRRSDYEVLNALKFNKGDIDGETALIIAVKKNNPEMVKYLLKKGADKNKPETFDAGDDISYGEKPIQIATKMKFTEIVKELK
ncbi:ankyrin repeat domain-containing protein [Flavobacterium piscisymbiosum]|uniref:Ankyrin repeat domain-containing protein n=1 Tax=Flavobacterium piscisymbiosum TaxID=2893753 RepID=A0ABS8MEK0_9FLAO|nr:ankyrin repeat domain-containing protein [Flavobacterium sp. F-30]MCC9063798.1 ankyrin repeat domain-containing protein [Flavobacterium sp. F-30]